MSKMTNKWGKPSMLPLAVAMVLIYVGLYLPIAHAATLEKMGKELEEKHIEVEKVIETNHEITSELTKEVEAAVTEKKQAEEEKAKVEAEKVKVEAEKNKIAEELKQKEEALSKEKEELESKIKTLEQEKETLEQQVSLKKEQQAKEVQLARQVKPLQRSSGSVSNETVQVVATSYTADCRGCTGITATGLDIRTSYKKIIAVDPKVIPLGTQVELFHNGQSLGQYTAADKGGAIKGNKIDILMPSKQEAYKWGRRTIELKIVN